MNMLYVDNINVLTREKLKIEFCRAEVDLFCITLAVRVSEFVLVAFVFLTSR